MEVTMLDVDVKYYKSLYVKESYISGTGLFAGEDIVAGELILRFGGAFALASERYSGKYLESTFIGVNEDVILCETIDSQKDYSDYINHSCEPNAGMKDCLHIVAIKDIKKDEEILCDYAFWESDENWILNTQCNCGSVGCRKTISGKDWMKITQEDTNFNFFHRL